MESRQALSHYEKQTNITAIMESWPVQSNYRKQSSTEQSWKADHHKAII